MSEEKKLEYNEIDIKDLKTGNVNRYTINEISWTRDLSINENCVRADGTVNQTELWIARLHEATGLEDTVLRKMDRRTFETLITKWILVNDVDQSSFLEISKTEKKIK